MSWIRHRRELLCANLLIDSPRNDKVERILLFAKAKSSKNFLMVALRADLFLFWIATIRRIAKSYNDESCDFAMPNLAMAYRSD